MAGWPLPFWSFGCNFWNQSTVSCDQYVMWDVKPKFTISTSQPHHFPTVWDLMGPFRKSSSHCRASTRDLPTEKSMFLVFYIWLKFNMTSFFLQRGVGTKNSKNWDYWPFKLIMGTFNIWIRLVVQHLIQHITTAPKPRKPPHTAWGKITTFWGCKNMANRIT